VPLLSLIFSTTKNTKLHKEIYLLYYTQASNYLILERNYITCEVMAAPPTTCYRWLGYYSGLHSDLLRQFQNIQRIDKIQNLSQ
jgi:hypothetical protein